MASIYEWMKATVFMVWMLKTWAYFTYQLSKGPLGAWASRHISVGFIRHNLSEEGEGRYSMAVDIK
jgi:hypothetical protein